MLALVDERGNIVPSSNIIHEISQPSEDPLTDDIEANNEAKESGGEKQPSSKNSTSTTNSSTAADNIIISPRIGSPRESFVSVGGAVGAAGVGKSGNQIYAKGAWKTPFYLLAQNMLFTFSLLPLTIYELYFHRSTGEKNVLTNPGIRAILTFFCLMAVFSTWGMWLVYLLKKTPKSSSDKQPLSEHQKSNLREQRKFLFSIMQSSTMVALTFYFTILLICRSYAGMCSNRLEFPMDWNCNPYYHVPIFPMDTAFKSMVCPMIYVVVMKEKRTFLSLGSWIITMIGLIVSAIHLNSIRAIPVILIYGFISLLVMIDSYVLQSLVRNLVKQLKESMEERQKLADKQKTAEMKDVIANVAHDLKTVLSSSFCAPSLIFFLFLVISPLLSVFSFFACLRFFCFFLFVASFFIYDRCGSSL
jgi:hypothetical protein